MSIFRRRSSGTDSGTDPVRADGEQPAGARPGDAAAGGSSSVPESAPAAAATEAVADGPHDAGAVDGPGERIDLGSLWLSGTPGMELRLEVDQSTGEISAAHVVLGDSTLQLQAFAAPRTLGIWDEIRGEIAESITSLGGTADEADGAFGLELRTRMPQAGPDGRTVFAPARFLGVDGPRWFLRGVLSGPAAIDDGAASPLVDVLRSLVVVRGEDPMAPREMLPLNVPDLPGDAETADGSPDETPPDEDDATGGLNPFERGPEITEVR